MHLELRAPVRLELLALVRLVELQHLAQRLELQDPAHLELPAIVVHPDLQLPVHPHLPLRVPRLGLLRLVHLALLPLRPISLGIGPQSLQ